MSSPLPLIEIQIGGQSRPIRYGTAAQIRYDDLRPPGESLATLGQRAREAETSGQELPLSGMEAVTLLFVGLKDGARKRAQEGGQPPRPPSGRDELADWIDEMGGMNSGGFERVVVQAMEHFTQPGTSQNAASSKARSGNAKGKEAAGEEARQSQPAARAEVPPTGTPPETPPNTR